jgi:hypothetical protein
MKSKGVLMHIWSSNSLHFYKYEEDDYVSPLQHPSKDAFT